MSADVGGRPVENIWLDDGVAIPKMFGGSDEEYELHLAAIEYSLASAIIIRNRDDIKSVRHWSEHLEPFEHQIRNLITFCRRAPVAMIADEVGLGKTISAGLIMSELMTRRRITRTLVVCPKILMEQWQEELHSKFGINAVYESGRALLQHLRSDYPVVITTYHSARSYMDEITDAGFDMVVLDEAHKLKSLHGQPKPAKLALRMADALQDRAFRFVLMLTATPIQNSAWDLYSLIDLLTTAQFHENPLGDPARFQAEYLERIHGNRFRLKAERLSNFRHIISQYVMRAGRRTTNLPFPDRIVRKRTTAMEDGSGGKAEQLLAEALKGLNALQQVSLAEAMMSSNAAFAAQASNLHVRGERLRIQNPGLFRQIQSLAASHPLGSKFLILQRLIRQLRSKDPHFRLVVFTKRRATQEALVEAISRMEVHVGTIAGGQFGRNVSTIREFWKDAPGVNVIISTDAGAEGVNLQVCNMLVNYDLPWNPMIIEQRIGRVQRLGSSFQNVTVFNLTVKDSVEDRIIARLLEKFMTISNALGDIEPILSAAKLDSEGEGGIQEQLRQMVLAALAKKDVESSLAQIEENINHGKVLYEEEEAFVEETLGDHLEELHGAGPKIPDLEPVAPRMAPEEFVRRALAVDGAVVQEQSDGSLLVKRRGEAVFTATFDSTDPRLRVVGAYGRQAGSNIRLYEPGSPAFEQMIGEWSARTVHATKAVSSTLDSKASDLVTDWFRDHCTKVEYLGLNITDRQTGFVGTGMVRATAGVAHDRLDRLIEVDCGEDLPAQFMKQLEDAPQEQLRSVLNAAEMPEFNTEIIQNAVENDTDLGKFVDFYVKRLDEETEKAVIPERVQMARDNFSPRLSARVEAVRGFLADTLEVSARYQVDDETEYTTSFVIAPGRIVSAPELKTCRLSQTAAPADAFEQCTISGEYVLRHQLGKSEKSGRLAVPEHTRTCDVSGKTLISDEIAVCAVTSQSVDKDLLRTCHVTGDSAIAEQLGKCAFSGKHIRADQLVESEFSGKLLWQNHLVTCSISKKSGHVSELAKCAETGDYLLASFLEQCSESDKMVKADLLQASEYAPNRKALPRYFRNCEETGLKILLSEGSESAASGKWVLTEKLVPSDGNSTLKALPGELIACEASGRRVLPQETAICQDSHLRVHAELLETNSVTESAMLRSRMQLCPETNTWGRASDFAVCGSTGYLVNPSCLVRLGDGQTVLARLTIVCEQCGESVLRSESVATAADETAHLECTVFCSWTGERLLKKQAGPCPLTGLIFNIEFLSAEGSKPLEEAVAKQRRRLPADQDELLLRFVAENVRKPRSTWSVESPQTSVVAVAVLETGILGLRQTVWVGYVSRLNWKMLAPIVKI